MIKKSEMVLKQSSLNQTKKNFYSLKKSSSLILSLLLLFGNIPPLIEPFRIRVVNFETWCHTKCNMFFKMNGA